MKISEDLQTLDNEENPGLSAVKDALATAQRTTRDLESQIRHLQNQISRLEGNRQKWQRESEQLLETLNKLGAE